MRVCGPYQNFAYHDVADSFVGILNNNFIPHMSEHSFTVIFILILINLVLIVFITYIQR